MKLIYVAGPYRGKTISDVYQNIQEARKHAGWLWEQGWAVVCPHLNSAFMDGICPDESFILGDLEILSRCDAIYLLPRWQESKGATEEYYHAIRRGIEIIENY